MIHCKWVAPDKRKLFFILLCIVFVEIALVTVTYLITAEHARYKILFFPILYAQTVSIRRVVPKQLK